MEVVHPGLNQCLNSKREMTDAEPGQPVTNRRRFLRWTGGVCLIGTAGCSGGPSASPTTADTQTSTQTPTSTPTPTPTATATPPPEYSYEPITGTWTGVTYPQGEANHSFAKLEIVEDRAGAGEAIGTNQLLVEEDGEVLCEETLLAERSDPPTYWVEVSEPTPKFRGPCGRHDRHRFERTSDDYLQVYVQYNYQETEWRATVGLTREDD